MVHIWFIPSSIPICKALALLLPSTIIKTSFASIIVATPTVKADWGTFVMSLLKNLELAMIVSSVNCFSLVLDLKDEPGSLNAIWPSTPTPPKNKSIPPTSKIFSSYLLVIPFKILIFSLSISIWLKKLLYI